MNDRPLFSGLIISRPRPVARALTRFRPLAVALSIYLAAAVAFLLAPLVLLEAMEPVGARTPEPIRIFQPGRERRGTRGDGLPALRVREGGGSAARKSEPAPARPAPRRDLVQPDALPAPSPDGAPVPDPGSGVPEADGPPGSIPGPGQPGGRGTSDHGSLRGCDGCIGGGLEGPGDGGDSWDGPFQAGDPGVTQPIIVPASRALPRYPDLARRAGVQGTVILTIVIGPNGRVGEIEVLRSPDQRYGFDLAAIEAVKQWRYQPALMAGRPVAVHAQVMVEFHDQPLIAFPAAASRRREHLLAPSASSCPGRSSSDFNSATRLTRRSPRSYSSR